MHTIKRRIQHPQYSGAGYDFALLELDNDIQFNNKARPIQLAAQNQEFASGRMCLVTGWGHTYAPRYSSNEFLQGVLVPIYDNAKCKRDYASQTPYLVTNAMICAGFEEGGKGSCRGKLRLHQAYHRPIDKE